MILNRMPFWAFLFLISLGISGVDCATTSVEAKTTQSSPKSKSPSDSAADEAQIRAQILALGNSLAAGDGKGVAALWTTDGVYIAADGDMVSGRAALEKRFSSLFQAKEKQNFQLTPETIRVLSKEVGQSEGIVCRQDEPNAPADTRYLMVFVKEKGSWLIASAAETPVVAADSVKHESLLDLSWLIGEWNAQRNGASVRLKAEWAADKNFIHCKYEILKPNQPLQTDMQMIGWDPIKEHVVSWLFDASGGVGHGIWFRKDNKWIVETTAVEHNGSTASAINIIDPSEPNSFVWQSVNRTIDGVALGDTLPLKVERVTQ